MAFQSIWYFSDLPEKIVDVLEEDLSENFAHKMSDSHVMGDLLNKDKEKFKKYMDSNYTLDSRICLALY